MINLGLFLVGIVVGVMNSIAGGGMLIGFPVLIAAGMPALVANATSNIITLPGQLSSAYGYRKYLKKTPKCYLFLLLPCMAGGAIGATLLSHTSMDRFARMIPLLILFAVVLFAFQPFLHSHMHRHLHGPKKHRNKLGPLVIICLAMFPTAIYGGYFGAGFGFIMLAFLGFTKLHEIHQINAVKNVMAAATVGVSIICLLNSGLIDWRGGGFMAAGSLLGGSLGAHIAKRIPSHAIRVIVIAIGVSTAAYLFFKEYS